MLVGRLPVQAMEEEMAELTATGAPSVEAPVSREDSAHDMTPGQNLQLSLCLLVNLDTDLKAKNADCHEIGTLCLAEWWP